MLLKWSAVPCLGSKAVVCAVYTGRHAMVLLDEFLREVCSWRSAESEGRGQASRANKTAVANFRDVPARLAELGPLQTTWPATQ